MQQINTTYNMHLEIWHIWIIASIALFIIEIFTPSFVAGSIGIGALFAGIAAGIGLDTNWQLVAAAAFTAISFFTVRPVVIKLSKKNVLETNVDALIGQTGIVIEEIGDTHGYVKIHGDNWRSFSEDGNPISKDTKVVVTKMEGNKIYVKPKN